MYEYEAYAGVFKCNLFIALIFCHFFLYMNKFKQILYRLRAKLNYPSKISFLYASLNTFLRLEISFSTSAFYSYIVITKLYQALF